MSKVKLSSLKTEVESSVKRLAAVNKNLSEPAPSTQTLSTLEQELIGIKREVWENGVKTSVV
jgi:hypothetical protein